MVVACDGVGAKFCVIIGVGMLLNEEERQDGGDNYECECKALMFAADLLDVGRHFKFVHGFVQLYGINPCI